MFLLVWVGVDVVPEDLVPPQVRVVPPHQAGQRLVPLGSAVYLQSSWIRSDAMHVHICSNDYSFYTYHYIILCPSVCRPLHNS